jgi:putative chitinase
MKRINRNAFFDLIKKTMFGGVLVQSQVDNMNAILNAIETVGVTNRFWAAHPLATVFIEVGPSMKPVREGFTVTDLGARNFVRKQHYAYAVEAGPYDHMYYGRGYPQLTWLSNYAEQSQFLKTRYGVLVDLVQYPDKMLDPYIGALVLVGGSMNGDFTGRKISDFGNDGLYRAVDARSVINGDKNRKRKGSNKTIGQEFANALFNFAAALEWAEVDHAIDPQPNASPAPLAPVQPVEDNSTPAPSKGFWSSLLGWLSH